MITVRWWARQCRSGHGADGIRELLARALTGQVMRSFDGAPSPRLSGLLHDLVRRLPPFAADNDFTQEEWQACSRTPWACPVWSTR